MEGFGLLLGHLLGDYTFQNGWMAANKVKSSFACGVHCTAYTAAVFLCCPFLPFWALAVIWLTHFPIDRWRLARQFMRLWHEDFATGPLAPWSIVVIDNIFHLLVLYLIGCAIFGLPT